ncbi:MAG: hypothetical protein K6F50_05975 [Kiritimatiellae bacterium]|nr:hypothetical protein [Kiritimatiellia bacterium]
MNVKILLLSAILAPALRAAEYRDVSCPEAPFPMPAIKEWLPPSAVFSVADFGADGSLAADTRAFALAVDAAAKAGGGRVLVPAGEWLSGPIRLKSDVELHLSEGAVVKFTDDPRAYEPAVETSWEGVELKNYSPLVYAFGCTNVAVTGKGVFAPEMKTWKRWFSRPRPHMAFTAELYRWCSEGVPVEQRDALALKGSNARPHLLQFNRCANIVLDGFKIRESPFWTIHLYHSENAVVRNLDVRAHGHNNDGIDIEMTRNVLVEKCRFDQGDDAVVLKAGRNRDGWRLARPTENVVVRDCTVVDGHVLLGIGSEMSGGVRNVFMHDCHAVGDVINIFYIKTNRRRGGFIENIWMKDCSAANAERSVVAAETDILYQWRNLPTYEERVTRIRNINVENVACRGSADRLLLLKGDSANPIDGVTLKNVTLGRARKKPVLCVNAVNVTVDSKPVAPSRENLVFTVGRDGDLKSALEAAAARPDKTKRFIVFFPDGEYDVSAALGDANGKSVWDSPNVSFVGQSMEKTVLFNRSVQEGIGITATLCVRADDILFQDLTVLNRSGFGLDVPPGGAGRHVAVEQQGDRFIYRNVRLLAGQDTYYTKVNRGAGRTYWRGGEIHGTVDFICGDGDIFFDRVKLVMRRKGGYLTAAATSVKWGYVFSGCTVDASDPAFDGTFMLGRSWRSAKTVFIDTRFLSKPSAEAWGRDMNSTPQVYGECGSVDADGKPLDMSGRKTFFSGGKDGSSSTRNTAWSAADAAPYTLDAVLSGDDEWRPDVLSGPLPAPVLKKKGSVYSWKPVRGARDYAVFASGVYVTHVSDCRFDAKGFKKEKIEVRAANSLGGLGDRLHP